MPCTAPNAIGFELSAAAMGGAVLPDDGGLGAEVGLEVVGPVLVVSAIVIFGLHEAVVTWQLRAAGERSLSVVSALLQEGNSSVHRRRDLGYGSRTAPA